MTYNIVRSFPKNGSRIFSTILISLLLCSAFLLPSMIQNAKASPGIGYFVIVAGRLYVGDHRQGAIDGGCNKLYRVLLDVGFTKDRIYYLCSTDQDVDGDGHSDVDVYSSSVNLQNAIETWAEPRVGPFEPLFLYMFDHGGGPPCCGGERFCINVGDTLSSTTLEGWLDTLEEDTNARIHVIYAACHSGSFINELSKSGRIIVSSCQPEQHSYVSSDWNWEAFSQPFWKEVQSGHSVRWSFNYACEDVKSRQTPLLDDNGDDTGHTGPLPDGGDGFVASGVYIGSRWSWVFPWIAYVIGIVTRVWPTESSVTLWAKVETEAPLLNVKAWMTPPDWSPPPPGETELIDMPLDYFDMTDLGDGNYTVNIPAEEFLEHPSEPHDFKFTITAEDEDGNPAISRMTRVVFTETGEPPEDNTSPRVNIERPIEDRQVRGTIHIKGIATDDACLDRVELYVNGDYKQTIDLSPTSNSFFDFSFETTTVSDGPKIIMVKAFDTSENWGTQASGVIVKNQGVGVGGIIVPVDKLGLLAPHIGVALMILVATAATVIYSKRVKRGREKQ